MPHPEAPDYEPWKAKLAKELAKAEDGIILMGHSFGGTVLLKYLSEHKVTQAFAGLFIIATPFWGLPGWTYKPFYLKRAFATRLGKVGKVFIYHGQDDESISRAHPLRYAREIPKSKVREIEGFGHAFDTGECPALIKDIRSRL